MWVQDSGMVRQVVEVSALVKEKVLVAVMASALAVGLVTASALVVQELALAMVLLLVLSSLLVLVWNWALEKELVSVLVMPRDSVQEWVLEQRPLRLQQEYLALVPSQPQDKGQ